MFTAVEHDALINYHTCSPVFPLLPGGPVGPGEPGIPWSRIRGENTEEGDVGEGGRGGGRRMGEVSRKERQGVREMEGER